MQFIRQQFYNRINKIHNMKRQLILISVFLLFIVSVQARSFVLDGINYNITSAINPFSVSVTSGISYSGDIVIPSSVNYNDTIYTVNSIGSNAFNGCSSLSSVSVPNTVISIGSGAFYGCSGLGDLKFDPTNQYFYFNDGILYNGSKNQII